MEYICFFHPRVKGTDRSERCDACNRRFDFPTSNIPTEVAGFEIEEELGRGFYAVAYRVRHKKTGIPSVVKVTPKTVYDLPDPYDDHVGGYGDRRDFERECRLHAALMDVPEVARISDWGTSEAQFGDQSLEVYWAQMDLVRGLTVDHYFTQGMVLGPRAVAQIAEDLLLLSDKLQTQGIFHNDLHGGNAILVSLPPEKHRRRAIEPTLAVRVFDLGSAARGDKANLSRLSDLEQVSLQMHRLLDRFDAEHDDEVIPSDIRLAAQLRKVAQSFLQSDWSSRRSTPSDMLMAVRRAYVIAVHPEQFRPIEFQSIQDHYNAQTLPSAYARELIYDPDGQWTKSMTSAGPQLVVGMRGCGKTMLLRSLEWTAHAVIAPQEDASVALERLRDQSYLGLFVSCAYLLRAPRERVGKGALQRLYLAYAREAIRAVQTCEVQNLGELFFDSIDDFSDLLAATVPTYNAPNRPTTLPRIELELSKAIQRDVPEPVQQSFVPLEAFTQMARAIRGLVDIWARKTVLFLLDDVSKRFVAEEDLSDLITQFCLKSEAFGFKISTETQTQILHSPSGERALEGRDYQVFHLGDHVLEALKGTNGVKFLERILDLRQRALTSEQAAPARQRLGEQPLSNLASALSAADAAQEQAPKTYAYFGLSALASICVGDIGDVLQIFHKMTRGVDPRALISPRRQHEILVNESRLRLLSLVNLDVATSWFFLHSAAFARASHRELVNRSRLRQYSDVFVEISTEDPGAFRQLMDLIDNGVYVIIGFRQRSKTTEGPPIYQFALRFRKILGLNFGIPLGNRDRFELTGQAVNQWLAEPRSERLTPLEASGTDWDRGWLEINPTDNQSDDEISIADSLRVDLPRQQPTLFDDEFTGLPPDSDSPSTPGYSRRVAIDEIPLSADTVDWSRATLIVAAGFEDRAVGALEAYAKRGIELVGQVQIACYANEGHLHSVREAASVISNDVTLFQVESMVDPSAMVQELLSGMPPGPVVVDVSALSKPLIFAFVKSALGLRKQVFVTHTAAADYDPKAHELNPAMEALNRGSFPEGLRLLDEVTPGEGTSFSPLVLGTQSIDASLRSILITFVTLKYRRLDSLLESIATDKVVGIRTTHLSDRKSVESRVIGLISEYLIASRNGELRSIGSMEARDAYDVLMEYYDQYVLDNAYRIELALTGTKMQTVGAAAFCAVAHASSVFYSIPHDRDTDRFTHGVGDTRFYELSVHVGY